MRSGYRAGNNRADLVVRDATGAIQRLIVLNGLNLTATSSPSSSSSSSSGGTGINADTLQGYPASAFAFSGHNHSSTYAALVHVHDYAASNHNHDLVYAAIAHNHDLTYAAIVHVHDYAASNHTHDLLYSALGHTHDYAASNHNHDSTYAVIGHNHDGSYAALVHTHDYAASNHTHDLLYSAIGHTHDYAASNHNHDLVYAAIAHNHDLAYAAIVHVHDYAASNHNHDLVYAAIAHNHDLAYAALVHTHDYAASNHNHDLVYAVIGHNHDQTYAALVHTHDYAASNHNHDLTYAGLTHASRHADGGADEITPLAIGAKSLHGFVDRSESILALDDNTRKVTITPNTAFNFWVNGSKFTKSVVQEVTIDNTAGLHYCSESDAGVLQKSMDPWDITGLTAIPALIVWWNGSAGRVWEERHGYDRDKPWHKNQHLTRGASYYNGLDLVLPTVGTPNDFEITTGTTYDEDIPNVTGNETQCIICYRSSAVLMTFDSVPSNVPYKMNGSNLRYDNAATLTDAASNAYVNMWLYATNDIAVHPYIVLGQAVHTTLAAARAEGRPTIPMSTAEWALCYKLIYRNTGAVPSFIEAIDYRNVQSGPPINYTAPATVAAQNVLVDSTGYTGTLSGKTTAQTALDALDKHAASHQSNGADVIKLDDLSTPDDNTDLNASTSRHGLLLKATAPSSGLVNVVGIANGESAYTNKALFDSTNPAATGTANPGTAVIAARRDHVHALSEHLHTSASTGGELLIPSENLLINGSFLIAQRGTTFADPDDDTYTFDRWNFIRSTADVYPVVVSQKTDTPPIGLSSYASLYFDPSDTGPKCGLVQILEARDTRRAGFQSPVSETVSLSVKLKKNLSGTFNARVGLLAWSGTADAVTSDVVSSWNDAGTLPTLATNWQFVSVSDALVVTSEWQTFKLENIGYGEAKNIAVMVWTDFYMGPSDEIKIADVSLVKGPVARAARGRPESEELALCQRYYEVITGGHTSGEGRLYFSAYTPNTNWAVFIVPFKVRKRAKPTSAVVTGTGYWNYTYCQSLQVYSGNVDHVSVQFQSTSTGLCWVFSDSDDAKITAEAEL
jgi:hypothetical protein